MTTAQTKRCASSSCREDGTLQCGKCKVIFYCSKTCQKEHWAKHKQHCSLYVPMPGGILEFLNLSREARNKASLSSVKSHSFQPLTERNRSTKISLSLATRPPNRQSMIPSSTLLATPSASEISRTAWKSV
ncbi:MAG: zinc finger MYND domain-containing protein [Hymenobacter sp.]|nr:MAG: zinc finger MYND domain-containing protein [Hymenobacter sp.]